MWCEGHDHRFNLILIYYLLPMSPLIGISFMHVFSHVRVYSRELYLKVAPISLNLLESMFFSFQVLDIQFLICGL